MYRQEISVGMNAWLSEVPPTANNVTILPTIVDKTLLLGVTWGIRVKEEVDMSFWIHKVFNGIASAHMPHGEYQTLEDAQKDLQYYKEFYGDAIILDSSGNPQESTSPKSV